MITEGHDWNAVFVTVENRSDKIIFNRVSVKSGKNPVDIKIRVDYSLVYRRLL